MNSSLIERVVSGHKKRFHTPPSGAAYAPGRVEILGNHTDYNEGYVLSAAIDAGICAVVSAGEKDHCVLSALDLSEETTFDLPAQKPVKKNLWANYIIGVVNKLGYWGEIKKGFNLSFAGDVPPGAGLSSSAALEVAVAFVLSPFYGLELPKLQLARLCQQAENEFTGARCGLLDQISSIFGAEHALVFTDFRSLAVETVPVNADMCFLLANTKVKHNLVESAYNERRHACEQAAEYFKGVLDHPVRARLGSLREASEAWALRDVSMEELTKHSATLDPVIIRRAKHIIGENERVLTGRRFLLDGSLKDFGRLMFASHESSRYLFENSCPELDFIVDTAAGMEKVSGARLSGGGFGGSTVLLINPNDTAIVSEKILSAYVERFGTACSIHVVKPSAGARILNSW